MRSITVGAIMFAALSLSTERAPTVPGAPNTVAAMAELTAVSIRMSNVRPHVQETADFANQIHSICGGNYLTF